MSGFHLQGHGFVCPAPSRPLFFSCRVHSAPAASGLFQSGEFRFHNQRQGFCLRPPRRALPAELHFLPAPSRLHTPSPPLPRLPAVPPASFYIHLLTVFLPAFWLPSVFPLHLLHFLLLLLFFFRFRKWYYHSPVPHGFLPCFYRSFPSAALRQGPCSAYEVSQFHLQDFPFFPECCPCPGVPAHPLC